MGKRDITIAVCGMVLGLMVGAGSLVYRETPLLAVASSVEPVPVRPENVVRDLMRRRLRGEGTGTRDSQGSFVPLKTPTETGTTGITTSTAPACDTVRDVTSRISLHLDEILPSSFRDSTAARNVQIAGDIRSFMELIVAEYCRPDSAPLSQQTGTRPSAPSTGKVSNNCRKYTGARYTQCITNQSLGLPYPEK